VDIRGKEKGKGHDVIKGGQDEGKQERVRLWVEREQLGIQLSINGIRLVKVKQCGRVNEGKCAQ